jgi:hypothetical protein
MHTKIITRSRILGFHPIDVYMNQFSHFENMTFIEYFTIYKSNKLKCPSSKCNGEDNLQNYIYTTNKFTRFINFHPTHNIKGFFITYYYKMCVFKESLIYSPHPIWKKTMYVNPTFMYLYMI